MEVEKSPSSLFNTEKHRFDRCLKLRGGIIHGDGVTPLATLEGRALIGEHVVISQDRWSIVSAWPILSPLELGQTTVKKQAGWPLGYGTSHTRQHRKAAAQRSGGGRATQGNAVERGGWRATQGGRAWRMASDAREETTGFQQNIYLNILLYCTT